MANLLEKACQLIVAYIFLTKGGFPIEIKTKISKLITYGLAIFIV